MNKIANQISTIEEKIFIMRGLRVMFDSHLAELYGVETRILIRNMKRHRDRFPSDFMFQLTTGEFENLRSQIGMSSSTYGGRRYPPYAFTENGVAMLSSILNSKQAIQVNIQIMRAFTKLREWLATHSDLQEKIRKLEEKFDQKYQVVFDAIKALQEEPKKDGPEKLVNVKGFDR
jgi:phage regulator Rha-like protein